MLEGPLDDMANCSVSFIRECNLPDYWIYVCFYVAKCNVVDMYIMLLSYDNEYL